MGKKLHLGHSFKPHSLGHSSKPPDPCAPVDVAYPRGINSAAQPSTGTPSGKAVPAVTGHGRCSTPIQNQAEPRRGHDGPLQTIAL
jgi:hypothetical protein